MLSPEAADKLLNAGIDKGPRRLGDLLTTPVWVEMAVNSERLHSPGNPLWVGCFNLLTGPSVC